MILQADELHRSTQWGVQIMAAIDRPSVMLAAEVAGYSRLIRAGREGHSRTAGGTSRSIRISQDRGAFWSDLRGDWRLSARRLREPDRGGAVRRRAARRHDRSQYPYITRPADYFPRRGQCWSGDR